ncbi:MAG: PLP-dependent aminotransferase family protein [Burkholderiaceae bacterium]
MDLPLTLDRRRPEPLHAQLFDGIRGLILAGSLTTGQRVPATRDLANQLGISRNTVRLAYERLIAEGYLEARRGAATRVAIEIPDVAFRAAPPATTPDQKRAPRRAAPPHERLQDIFAGERFDFDFALGRPDASAFPARPWREFAAEFLDRAQANTMLARYGDPAGYLPLREAIARQLAATRGMRVAAEQVMIVSGSQGGLHLACRLICDAHRPSGIEDPCYQGALFLFRALQRPLQAVPVDREGLRIDRLPATGFDLLYVTPSHQYPTGVTLTLERRLALLEWAERTDSLILEDDYDSDFRYVGPPLTALAGLDPYGRVLYLGTFSKSLGPALRVGYLVVPQWLAERARIALGLMTGGHDLLTQAILARLLSGTHFELHLRRLRRLYNERRRRLIAALRARFGAVELLGSEAGLHLAWHLDPDWPDPESVRGVAASAGVGVYTARCGGSADQGLSALGARIVTLGFSALPAEAIDAAVERLEQALQGSEFEPSLRAVGPGDDVTPRPARLGVARSAL